MIVGVACATSAGGFGRTDEGRRDIRRGHVAPYPLTVRPLAAAPSAAPVVDLRGSRPVDRAGGGTDGDGDAVGAEDPWTWAIDEVRRAAGADQAFTLVDDTIKPFDRRRGADADQLARVLDRLDAGHPVAFYGWWPVEEVATTTEILGIDAMEVPPPDRKRAGLVDGHALVIVGYGRHAAFPGGGYVIVRNSWRTSGWGDAGCGYMPFAYLRAYATELRAIVPGSRREPDGDGPSRGDRPAAGTPRLPAVAPRDATDVAVDRQARCADPRGSLTHLFFSEQPLELARARAICSVCAVRTDCLARALARREPYGIWGGEMLVDGRVVPDKRGRGRPPKRTPGRLVVDEVTGIPIVA